MVKRREIPKKCRDAGGSLDTGVHGQPGALAAHLVGRIPPWRHLVLGRSDLRGKAEMGEKP